MKKAFGLILFAAMLFACVSCQVKSGGLNDKESQQGSTVTMFENEIETTPSQEEKLPSVLFSSYDDVLNTLSKIAKQEGKESFEAGMPKLDSREQEIYQRLCGITSQMLNTPKECTLHCSLLDLDGDGTEEMHAVALLEEDVWNLVPLEKTETFFTIRGGVPSLDDGSLLERYRQMKQNETPSIKPIQDPLVTHPHYRMTRLDFQNEKAEKIEYQIYSSDGALVKTGDARTSFWGYCEGDLIEFSADYRIFFYSISQNKFSEVDFPGFVEFSIVSQKAVYVRNGILTVQDIFDRNTYYEEFPTYQGPYSYYFAEDGKSLSFRHVVEGAKKDATSVICFEELPIIRATKICYVRTGPGTDYDVLMLSSGTYSYLRPATQDTARLLQAEPIIGGSYESDNGTVRNDWYKISYYGRECYVSADSFEVEIYRANEDTPAQNENPDLAPSEAEIAMEMYEAFLKNEIPSESGYLKNHREDYLMDYLWERNGSVHYAYVDMDGDGQVELLVSGIDTFVFSYYHDCNVISIATTYNFREMNRVYVDGSYSWNYPSSDGVSYGLKKYGKDIWRIENEGGSYTLYYIGEESVTQAEMLKYLEENPNPEEVTFTRISGEGWNKVIGKERAEEIASKYWNIKDGDIDEQTGKEYSIYVSAIAEEKYYIRLCLGYSPYDPDIDALYIDAITGEIVLYEPNAKG